MNELGNGGVDEHDAWTCRIEVALSSSLMLILVSLLALLIAPLNGDPIEKRIIQKGERGRFETCMWKESTVRKRIGTFIIIWIKAKFKQILAGAWLVRDLVVGNGWIGLREKVRENNNDDNDNDNGIVPLDCLLRQLHWLLPSIVIDQVKNRLGAHWVVAVY